MSAYGFFNNNVININNNVINVNNIVINVEFQINRKMVNTIQFPVNQQELEADICRCDSEIAGNKGSHNYT